MAAAIQIRSTSAQWQTAEALPGLRWQFMVNQGETDSHGISTGFLQIDPGHELPLHHHEEQEIYLITTGQATLLEWDGQSRSLQQGDVVYIPGNAWHGIRNTGQGTLAFTWVFPTDTWQQVEYLFENTALTLD